MSDDLFARVTLAAYLAVGLVLVLWHAARCPNGWLLWGMHAIDSLYCRLCFHWRSNRRCPFLEAPSGIVIANHRSPVDPLLIWAGVSNGRPVEFMTAHEYFGIRGLVTIFRTMRAIPVARNGRDMAATRAALRCLHEGRLVGVFPEGRINTGTGLLPGNPGIAWLALHSKSPVYPVFIENAPRGKGMVDPFWRFTRVRVNYGEAVDLSPYYGRKTTPKLLQEVTDLLMRRLAELGGVETAADPAGHDGSHEGVVPMHSATA
jgi:1-acyl-sn-glycerol-3-phosphate acyltransferase